MKKHNIILSAIHILLMIASLNFASKAQKMTENYSGMYYSDTIVDSPTKSHIYFLRLVKDIIEINKINIEYGDSLFTLSIPNTKIVKNYKHSYVKKRTHEILYEAPVQVSSKLNEFKVFFIDKFTQPILKVQFLEEFMTINYSTLEGFNEGAKLYKYVTYDTNGETRVVGSYKDGKKHGYWLIYNEDNTITTKDYFYGNIKK